VIRYEFVVSLREEEEEENTLEKFFT